ncbi:MAG: hypothetical protein H6993_14095 [Pseudomonadales bacterium]|nr:hypothetical protein [Pseudomonadales bacterium]MCP5185091.1 hypothetical protein [Pseudomonadales bacterium]
MDAGVVHTSDTQQGFNHALSAAADSATGVPMGMLENIRHTLFVVAFGAMAFPAIADISTHQNMANLLCEYESTMSSQLEYGLTLDGIETVAALGEKGRGDWFALPAIEIAGLTGAEVDALYAVLQRADECWEKLKETGEEWGKAAEKLVAHTTPGFVASSRNRRTREVDRTLLEIRYLVKKIEQSKR